MKYVLIVDDDPMLLSSIEMLFKSVDCDVMSANSAEDALPLLEQNSFNLVISDMKMDGMSGLDLLGISMQINPDTTRILLSGDLDHREIIKAKNDGIIHHCLKKPCDNDEILEKCNIF